MMCCVRSCGGHASVRNPGGFLQDWCDELEAAARDADPTARVWRGSHEDRSEDQGIIILGTPVGRPEFVEREFANIVANHRGIAHKNPCKSMICSVRGCCCFTVGSRADFYIRTVDLK